MCTFSACVQPAEEDTPFFVLRGRFQTHLPPRVCARLSGGQVDVLTSGQSREVHVGDRVGMVAAGTRRTALGMEDGKLTGGSFQLQSEGLGDQLDAGGEGEDERKAKSRLLV